MVSLSTPPHITGGPMPNVFDTTPDQKGSLARKAQAEVYHSGKRSSINSAVKP